MPAKKKVPERYLLPTIREKDAYMAQQDARIELLKARVRELEAALEAAEPFLCLLWPRVRLPKGVRRPEGWEWELFKRRATAALKDEP